MEPASPRATATRARGTDADALHRTKAPMNSVLPRVPFPWATNASGHSRPGSTLKRGRRGSAGVKRQNHLASSRGGVALLALPPPAGGVAGVSAPIAPVTGGLPFLPCVDAASGDRVAIPCGASRYPTSCSRRGVGDQMATTWPSGRRPGGPTHAARSVASDATGDEAPAGGGDGAAASSSPSASAATVSSRQSSSSSQSPPGEPVSASVSSSPAAAAPGLLWALSPCPLATAGQVSGGSSLNATTSPSIWGGTQMQKRAVRHSLRPGRGEVTLLRRCLERTALFCAPKPSNNTSQGKPSSDT